MTAWKPFANTYERYQVYYGRIIGALPLNIKENLLLKPIMPLVVVSEGEVVGVIREQDLFFEMEKILRG